MNTPHDTPAAANDLANKMRGDLEAIFAKVAKQAQSQANDPSAPPIDTAVKQGVVDSSKAKTAPSS